MVKTTVNLDDIIYEEVVKESIEKYGSTKNISKIINERLMNQRSSTKKGKKRVTFRVKKELAELNADQEIRAGWERINQ